MPPPSAPLNATHRMTPAEKSLQAALSPELAMRSFEVPFKDIGETPANATARR
jgi:hypothetical protein